MGRGYKIFVAPCIWRGTGIQLIVCPFYNAVRWGYKLSFVLFKMLWDGDAHYRLPLLYVVVHEYKLSFALFIMLWDGIQIIVCPFYNNVGRGYKLSFEPFYNAVRRDYKLSFDPIYNAVGRGYRLSFALFIILWDGNTNYCLPFL